MAIRKPTAPADKSAAMAEILASHSRARAGFTAPAQGLFLWDVTY